MRYPTSAWTIALAALACACAPSEAPVSPGDPVITTIAGQPERLGYNGDGLAAAETWLYYPTAITWDPEGRLVVDDFNNMRIRRMEDDGRLVTLAGTGWHGYAQEGVAATTSDLENPVDVAYGPDGTLFIAELHAGRILSVQADGVLRYEAGRCDEVACTGFFGDGGPALSALLSQAAGVTVDATGRILIADTENHCLRVVEVDGTIHRLAGDGTAGLDDAGLGRFDGPQRLVVDGERVLVADAGNNVIRAVDLTTGAVTTIAGTGERGFEGDGGPATSAQLNMPYGVDVDASGVIYVADFGNQRVRRIAPDGTISTIAGTGEKGYGGDGGPPEAALFSGPVDVLPGPNGSLLVADMFNGIIRRIEGLDP